MNWSSSHFRHSEAATVAPQKVGGDFYNGIEWFACWLLDNAEGEIIEEVLREWAVLAWQAFLKKELSEQSAVAPQKSLAVGTKKKKASDQDIRDWAARHDINASLTDLRCMFEDARSLAVESEEQRGFGDKGGQP